MDPKSAAQTIRDTVTMDQILSLYGYETKHGFMVCPFHGDKDASLKIYKGTGGWHCFGCGKGGSVIDFVMEQEGCDFKTAVIAIDKALRLGLADPREDPYEAEEWQARQKWLDDFATYMYGQIDTLKKKYEIILSLDLARMKELETLKLFDHEKLTAADYDFMNQWKDTSQFNEYKIEKLDELREEVAEWRRSHRKAPSASSQKT